jgi:alanine dehydrogenase
MDIGVPKEIKNHEYRVGLTPESVQELIKFGHNVMVETNAGIGIGATDSDYQNAGAKIALSAQAIFDSVDMIVKVKEPQANERKMLREGQILFTYLHLAPDREQTKDLIQSKAICIAYETVTDNQGGLPLLKPMSQVAGKLSSQAAATALQISNGGSGILIGGVPGVSPAKIVVIGGGIVGENAIETSLGLGAKVVVLDRNINVLTHLSHRFGASLETVFSTNSALHHHVITADIVIGAVLVAGASAPKLVTRTMISQMKKGSVLVDVAIDQGGCFETSRPTTHSEPTYIIDDIVHYCVANMPGAVPKTSTYALNNATLPFTLALANKGYEQAMLEDAHLLNGLNIYKGHVTCAAVANALGYDYVNASDAIKNSA